MRCLVVLVVMSIASPALAHFRLIAPDATHAQDATGSPQFTAPCGDSAAPSGPITQFNAGSIVAIDLQETIFHPGHYRVAFAPTMAMLPPDPQVTGAMCNSATIDASPSLPVLLDGALQHTTQFPSAQTIQVTLPTTPCTDCFLQIIEFTSNHAEPCFHYHCAMITIKPPPMVDAGMDAMTDGGSTNDAGPNDDASVGDDAGSQNALTNPYANQGCSTTGGSNGLFLILVALVFRRRSQRT